MMRERRLPKARSFAAHQRMMTAAVPVGFHRIEELSEDSGGGGHGPVNGAGSVRQQLRRGLRSRELCLRFGYLVVPLEVRGPPASLPDKAENGRFLRGSKKRLQPARDLSALWAGLPGLPQLDIEPGADDQPV